MSSERERVGKAMYEADSFVSDLPWDSLGLEDADRRPYYRLAEVAIALLRAEPVGEPERALADDILTELQIARTKFPGPNVTMLALMEEVGELAKASFEESRERVRKEAVQVATMAMRVVLDGDSTLDWWRSSKGLDPLREMRSEDYDEAGRAMLGGLDFDPRASAPTEGGEPTVDFPLDTVVRPEILVNAFWAAIEDAHGVVGTRSNPDVVKARDALLLALRARQQGGGA